MDPRRALVERNAHFTRGPRFFREGDAVMFEFVIDATNVLGPRPANDGDKRNHAGAWREFSRAEALSDLAREDAEVIFAPAAAVPEQVQGLPSGELPKRRKARA